MIDINANDTHPDAKPRAERERDDTLWAIAMTGFRSNSQVLIVTRNGDEVAGPLSRDMACEIVRLHNQSL